MLLKYVSEKGVVNYKEWIQEKDNLDAYIKTLEGMPPRDTGSKNQMGSNNKLWEPSNNSNE